MLRVESPFSSMWHLIMKPAILSAVLTGAIFASMGYLGWMEHDAANRPQDAPSQVAPRSSIAPSRSPAPAPPETVFKCLTPGGAVYQDRPCAGPTATLKGGTVTTIPAVTVTPRLLAAADPPRRAVGLIERQEATERDQWECTELRREVRQIDAAARVRSTTRLQERRRWVKRRMFDLKCAEIG